ncbi:MAG: peptide MFS transporter [Actinobacteria bacterium]|nr:peptide MFS transporter [Actinomycetota bacterium]
MSAIPYNPFDRTLVGQPRALATLFMTEMWERFSYYGMRALLVLFMITPTSDGGMGFSAPKAAGIYAIYVALVYLTPLPGGWIGDRLLGARRTVFVGGAIIAGGHIVLAIFGGAGLFPALALIIVGTGLLKPNMTAMVGGIYTYKPDLRDAGFSIYYMGINLGAFLAPLVCGYLGQQVSWELGFGVAALGMLIALVQYAIGIRGLGPIGAKPENPLVGAERRRFGIGVIIAAAAAVALVIVDLRFLHLSSEAIELLITIVIVLIPIAWFARTLRAERGNTESRNKVLVLLVLFVAAAVFWLVYDQAGSTVAIFAQEDTNNTLFGWAFPSSWFQSVNPLLIIALAPVMAVIWTALGARGKQPGTPYKFCGGLFLVAVSMLVMVFAAHAAIDGKVAALWLVAVFAIQTVGELMLSPVGMAAATRLSPPDRVSQTLGVWFLATSVGDAIGGRIAVYYDELGQQAFFGLLGVIALVAAIVVLAIAKPLGRLVPD